jgi:hypothetical protein
MEAMWMTGLRDGLLGGVGSIEATAIVVLVLPAGVLGNIRGWRV